ncbi:c6 zinc finger domain-containing protein [Fusarium circinatum]|uniref:C6 zinc finger domain-containing protein n=1 Tax=Fusarium circinatum TaxID=48490 RepID=A0A8H5WI55_FUSCI|nr:c6 zinc finger domain-containing protein [Fusarium circinatum]
MTMPLTVASLWPNSLPQGGCTDACSHVSSSASPTQRLLPQQGKVLATSGTATDSGSNGHSQPRPSDADEQNTDQSQEQVNNSGEFGTQAFGSLVHDSYGALRFVGGANNEFLLQAVDSLTLESCQGSDDSPYSVGSQHDTTKMIERPRPELPFFVHGLRWRDLPYLPKPEDVNLPPKYIADMLVGLYFEHYHYTFPRVCFDLFRGLCLRIKFDRPRREPLIFPWARVLLEGSGLALRYNWSSYQVPGTVPSIDPDVLRWLEYFVNELELFWSSYKGWSRIGDALRSSTVNHGIPKKSSSVN